MLKKFKYLIIFLITLNSYAFTNQKCYHEKPDEIKNIRILSKTVPCKVEVERIINGKNIKYILYKTERSFDVCEEIAGKELMATYKKDFQCEDEK